MTEERRRAARRTDLTGNRRDYQPDWRCRDCGAVFDEYPDHCPECGHGSFRAITR